MLPGCQQILNSYIKLRYSPCCRILDNLIEQRANMTTLVPSILFFDFFIHSNIVKGYSNTYAHFRG
jgi:hypothetical protein